MNKTITSTIKGYEGNVIIPRRFTMPQVKAWEAATRKQSELIAQVLADKENSDITTADLDDAVLRELFELVIEWHIADFPEEVTPENIPMSPRTQAHEFVAWLGGELRQVYAGEIDIPND